MTPRLRDYLILFAAFALALCLGAVLRQFFGAEWEFAIVVVMILLALGAVKARWPDHRAVRKLTWLHWSLAISSSAAPQRLSASPPSCVG